MNELIKIETKRIGSEEVNSVNARDLWEYLESKRKFTDWIQKRISDFEFLEDKDYTHVSQINETSTGATTKKEYYITIDMAKELSMIENNDKGRTIRKYFIEVEKRYRDMTSDKMTGVQYARRMLDLSQRLLNSELEKEKLIEENKEMTPKAEFYDAVTQSQDTFDMGEVSKLLVIKYPNGRPVGRNKMFEILRGKEILMDDKHNIPYQKYVDRGYFKVVEQKFDKPNGKTGISLKTVVFQKGIDFIKHVVQCAVDPNYEKGSLWE